MHIVIIGNGVAGTSVARHCRKLSDHKITVISEESEFFFSRTALMYIYMGHMSFKDTKPYEDHFWNDNKIDLIHDRVVRINRDRLSLDLEQAGELRYDRLVIATGSKPNMVAIPGVDLLGVQGLYHLKDLENLELLSPSIRSAVVVGGGLIGVELAEMLLSRGISVTMLVREKGVWASVLPLKDSQFVSSHISAHGIRLLYETELKSIEGGSDGRVTSITCNTGEVIDCDFVGITIGVSPDASLAMNSGIEVNRGVLVNDKLLTSDSNIYAVGDCAEIRHPKQGRRAIEAVWYTGKIMGETLAQTLCKQATSYEPGLWFNSAKFFDLEYQTYGRVESRLSPGDRDFLWESKDGSKLINFVYCESSRKLKGVNLFGTRGRHSVFEEWITSNKTIEFILENLSEALFDAEFSAKYENDLVDCYNSQSSIVVALKRKRAFFPFIKKR